MKIAYTVVVVILSLLAIFAGVTKVLLMPQDVEFFGQYGFSSSVLVVYGFVQLSGGLLLPLRKTRFVGAAIVAITFFVSLVVLLVDGNVPVSIVTIIMILLLGIVMKNSWGSAPAKS